MQETKTCCEEARLGKELIGHDHDQGHIDLGSSISPDKCLMPVFFATAVKHRAVGHAPEMRFSSSLGFF